MLYEQAANMLLDLLETETDTAKRESTFKKVETLFKFVAEVRTCVCPGTLIFESCSWHG